MPLTDAYIHPLKVGNSRGVMLQLSAIHHQTWTDALAIDDNCYLTTTAGPDTETLTPTLVGAYVTGGIGTAVHARTVIVTVTHGSSVVVCSGVITGTDIFGNVITAAWAVTATGTSKTSETAKAFKTITGVTLYAAADASANSVIIGDGDILGLEALCASIVPVAEEEDGAAPTAGTIVAGVAAHATADAWGTYDPNSALDDSADFDLWYLVDDPQLTNGSTQRAL